jgi:hypothetical protein
MANFGAFLMALVGPLARRVLLSLGLGVISYAGLSLVASQVVDAVRASYNGMTGVVLDLVNLIGFGQAVGIVLGAIVARAALAAVARIGVLSS